MSLNATELRQRVQRSTMRASRLHGVMTANAARKVEVTAAVASAKARQGLGDEVKRVFEALQTRAHERSVGTFDRLLTAILNDVLPEEGRVRLLPKYRDNTTWLDVLLEKNGHLEDILDGNGGAVTNVVSTGLRFASLTRTKNRPLMVLDEPDCWIKPEHIPKFIRVIAQVAEQTGVQTFFVSHFDDPEAFSGLVNIVRLAKDSNGNPRTEVVQPLVHQWPDDDVPGIRKIELVNFRRHVNTVVPCFPGATAFVGDNNLGKSTAIVSSLKAVAYGESDDSMVRHGCDEARIVIHLEKNQRVEWVRSTKRSPSVMYRLYEGDTLKHEGRPKVRNSAPDWVTDVMRIAKVDELDIQVGNQKSPVFLLDETASKRAQILSLGRESGHLKTLMQRYEALKTGDGETVKRGELELARLTFDLTGMATVPDTLSRLTAVGSEAEELCNYLSKRERIASLMARLEESASRVESAQRELAVLEQLPELPVLADVAKPKALADAIERSQSLLDRMQIPAMPELPTLTNTAAIAELGVRLTTSLRKLSALESLPADVPALPVLQDLAGLHRVIGAVDGSAARLTTATAELAAATAEETAARDALETLKTKLGVCPLCDSHLGSEAGAHNEHHAQ